MTQCEKVMQYMQEFGSITTLEAFKDLGITRLSARIHDLRDAGIEIIAESVPVTNRYGEKIHCTRYSLGKEN